MSNHLYVQYKWTFSSVNYSEWKPQADGLDYAVFIKNTALWGNLLEPDEWSLEVAVMKIPMS